MAAKYNRGEEELKPDEWRMVLQHAERMGNEQKFSSEQIPPGRANQQRSATGLHYAKNQPSPQPAYQQAPQGASSSSQGNWNWQQPKWNVWEAGGQQQWSQSVGASPSAAAERAPKEEADDGYTDTYSVNKDEGWDWKKMKK